MCMILIAAGAYTCTCCVQYPISNNMVKIPLETSEARFSFTFFNTVVDVFSRMLVKGSNAGLIRGLCSNLIPGG
jgi:hypothetical protein